MNKDLKIDLSNKESEQFLQFEEFIKENAKEIVGY